MVGRPKAAVTLDVNLNLRVDQRVREALRRVTEVWDRRAQEMGVRATEAGVVRALILREAEALGVMEPAAPGPVESKQPRTPASPKTTGKKGAKRA